MGRFQNDLSPVKNYQEFIHAWPTALILEDNPKNKLLNIIFFSLSKLISRYTIYILIKSYLNVKNSLILNIHVWMEPECQLKSVPLVLPFHS